MPPLELHEERFTKGATTPPTALWNVPRPPNQCVPCGRVSPHVTCACTFQYVVRWCQFGALGGLGGGAMVKHWVPVV